MEIVTNDESAQSESPTNNTENHQMKKYFTKSHAILPIANGPSYLKRFNVHKFHLQTLELKLRYSTFLFHFLK